MTDATPMLAYMTAPDEETALRLAHAMVDRRLVACVNILPPMTAVFRWNGAAETAAEVAMVAKTTAACADALSAFVADAHPYDTPCLTLTPIVGGTERFLAWIGEETHETGP